MTFGTFAKRSVMAYETAFGISVPIASSMNAVAMVLAESHPIKACSRSAFLVGRGAPGFNGLDAVYERLFQDAFADRSEHKSSRNPLRFLPSRTTMASMSVVPSG